MEGWLESDNKAISVQVNLTGTGAGTELGNMIILQGVEPLQKFGIWVVVVVGGQRAF